MNKEEESTSGFNFSRKKIFTFPISPVNSHFIGYLGLNLFNLIFLRCLSNKLNVQDFNLFKEKINCATTALF